MAEETDTDATDIKVTPTDDASKSDAPKSEAEGDRHPTVEVEGEVPSPPDLTNAVTGPVDPVTNPDNYLDRESDVPIEPKVEAFSGFMNGTRYGGAAVVLIVVFPVLVFGAGASWFPALLSTLGLGFLIGMALKLRGIWYGSIIATTFVLGLLLFLFVNVLGGDGVDIPDVNDVEVTTDG